MRLSISSDFFTNLAPMDECAIDNDCISDPAKPVCDTSMIPKVCVGKLFFDINIHKSFVKTDKNIKIDSLCS